MRGRNRSCRTAPWWAHLSITPWGYPRTFRTPRILPHTHPPFPHTPPRIRAQKKSIDRICFHCGSERIHRATWGVSQDSGLSHASSAGSANCGAAASSPALIVHVVVSLVNMMGLERRKRRRQDQVSRLITVPTLPSPYPSRMTRTCE